MRCHIVVDKAQRSAEKLRFYIIAILLLVTISLVVNNRRLRCPPHNTLIFHCDYTYQIVSLSVAAPTGKLGIFIPLPT